MNCPQLEAEGTSSNLLKYELYNQVKLSLQLPMTLIHFLQCFLFESETHFSQILF